MQDRKYGPSIRPKAVNAGLETKGPLCMG